MLATVLEWMGLAFIPLFLLADLVYGARKFHTPRFWRLQGLGVTLLNLVLSLAIATGWAMLVGERSVFDLSGLGIVGGALVGILVYEFAHYWYHRAAHSTNRLWRWAHQMHHSPESLDAFGAYYLHPVDVFNFTTLSSLVFFPLLGLQLEAGLLCAAFLTFNAMFQHANVRTPHWLGVFIQRPESHGVHHARDVHRHNYSDLPLWDMIFGTFHNPKEWGGEVGFYPGASRRVGAMLAGRDVSAT